MIPFPSAIYSLLTCSSVFSDVRKLSYIANEKLFWHQDRRECQEEMISMPGLLRLNEVALLPADRHSFPFLPCLSLCTITVIRMSNNVLLTPIVLTARLVFFHSSGTSHYLNTWVFWQGRSMPASQVYQWQGGLSPWTRTAELKQSKPSLLEYDEPF